MQKNGLRLNSDERYTLSNSMVKNRDKKEVKGEEKKIKDTLVKNLDDCCLLQDRAMTFPSGFSRASSPMGHA